MFTTWHGNYQKHHRIILWFSLSANMFLWIEEKGNFDLKTWIRELNQNKNRATTFWKASLDSKWLLMRVTAGSLKVNTSLAKLVSRQHLFLIGQDFLTRLENWSKSSTIGMVPSFIFWRLAVSEWPCWFLTRKTEGVCFLQSPTSPLPSLFPPPSPLPFSTSSRSHPVPHVTLLVSSRKFMSGLDFSGGRFFSFWGAPFFYSRGHFLGLEKGTAKFRGA